MLRIKSPRNKMLEISTSPGFYICKSGRTPHVSLLTHAQATTHVLPQAPATRRPAAAPAPSQRRRLAHPAAAEFAAPRRASCGAHGTLVVTSETSERRASSTHSCEGSFRSAWFPLVMAAVAVAVH